MMNMPCRTMWRWMETADGPAAFAALLAAAILTLGAASCSTSGTAPSRTPTRSALPATSRIAGEPDVRIRIAQRLSSVTLSGRARLVVSFADTPLESRLLNAPITARRGPTGWFLRDATGVPAAFTDPTPNRPAPLLVRTGDDSPVTLDDRPYPGEILLLARPPGSAPALAGAVPGPTPAPSPAPATTPGVASSKPVTSPGAIPGTTGSNATWTFDAIERVGLEAYLPGVVSKELLPNWSLIAYKAQAIAARSYAMHERQRSRDRNEPFDLEAGELDQAYAGAVEHPVAARAVRETRGMILKTQGRVLRAYYSSTCGGRPASAKSIWPTTAGFEFNLDAPIQGTQGPETACSASPRYRWSVTRPLDELAARIVAYARVQGLSARSMQGVAKVESASPTPDARPSLFTITDRAGAKHQISAEHLRNACNWPLPGAPDITPQTRVFSGDIEVSIQGASAIITGRGFGHGVGLCQYGAQGMSRSGSSHEQILAHYYPGATIERGY